MHLDSEQINFCRDKQNIMLTEWICRNIKAYF